MAATHFFNKDGNNPYKEAVCGAHLKTVKRSHKRTCFAGWLYTSDDETKVTCKKCKKKLQLVQTVLEGLRSGEIEMPNEFQVA